VHKIDITYIISHGFAARMVMQTNLLGRLTSQNLKVAVIVPDLTDEIVAKYCGENNIKLFEFSPQSNFWSEFHATSRKYFLEDIEKNPALLEKHIWDTKYNSSKKVLSKIRPRFLFFIYKFVQRFPFIRVWYKRREKKFLFSNQATELLKKLNTKILISTYPVNFTEAMLLNAANSMKNCKTIIHLLSWDNISCKGHFPELANEYIAWGPIMKNEFMEYYKIPEEKIHICGVPHFDLHTQSKLHPNYEYYLEKLKLNPKGAYLLFAMSSPRFAPNEIDIVEWLSKAVSNDEFGVGMQLVVRPHPQNIQGSMADQSWIPRLIALQTKAVKVDFPEMLLDSKMALSMQSHDMIKFSQLLAGARISLNSGSTVSIDSLVCNVPVILTAFDADFELEYWKSARRLIDFEHLKKMTLTGGISVVHNFTELRKEIQNYLKDKDLNIQQREHLLKLQCSSNHENATGKVVEVLTNMAN
jgi:hypothetical protein